MPRNPSQPLKTALITGASSGIGREFARTFAAKGHDLVITARRLDRLEELADDLMRRHGVRVWPLVADLTDREAPERLFDATEGKGRPIGVLVNNAGFGVFRDFNAGRLADQIESIEVNVVALTAMTRLFAPEMVRRGAGRILNVASVAGFSPVPSAAVYGATKAYVLSLSEALSAELDGTGVTVTALCPGLTETEFSARATGTTGASMWIPAAMKLAASDVAREGYRAAMAGEAVHVNGIAYRLGVEWLRFQPRVVTRMVGRLLGREMQNGF